MAGLRERGAAGNATCGVGRVRSGRTAPRARDVSLGSEPSLGEGLGMSAVTFDFGGAHVLVTGGTSGIGHAIATAFVDAGARVTITGTKAAASDYEIDLGPFTYHHC